MYNGTFGVERVTREELEAILLFSKPLLLDTCYYCCCCDDVFSAPLLLLLLLFQLVLIAVSDRSSELAAFSVERMDSFLFSKFFDLCKHLMYA